MNSNRLALIALALALPSTRASADAWVADLERHAPTDRVEVRLARVDGTSVDRSDPNHAVPAGRHTLDLACIAHIPGGMAEFTEITTSTVDMELADGTTYALNGTADAKGRCTAGIGPGATAPARTDR